MDIVGWLCQNRYLMFYLLCLTCLTSPYMSIDPKLRCRNTDFDRSFCSAVESVLGWNVLDQFEHTFASSLNQSYVNHLLSNLFQPNPFNETNYQSMAESINVIIFNP